MTHQTLKQARDIIAGSTLDGAETALEYFDRWLREHLFQGFLNPPEIHWADLHSSHPPVHITGDPEAKNWAAEALEKFNASREQKSKDQIGPLIPAGNPATPEPTGFKAKLQASIERLASMQPTGPVAETQPETEAPTEPEPDDAEAVICLGESQAKQEAKPYKAPPIMISKKAFLKAIDKVAKKHQLETNTQIREWLGFRPRETEIEKLMDRRRKTEIVPAIYGEYLVNRLGSGILAEGS